MRTLAAALLLALSAAARADVFHLENGGTLEGVILRETPASVTVRLKYATVTLDRSEILSIEKKASDDEGAPAPSRLARWDRVLEKAAARPWSADLRQVPATVIDKGILKYVPYISHKSGLYELNIYGDPDRPAGLEIGLYPDLIKSDAARKECVEFMASLLGDPQDAEALRFLNPAGGKKEREGLTFEVTPETAEDSYGGWWVSVYDVKELDAARASEEEIAKITVGEEDLQKEEEEEKARKKTAPKADPKKPSPSAVAAPRQEVIYIWRAPELRQARPSKPRKTGGGRRVYLKGLHRQGGVYVRPSVGVRGKK
jgi:hypothetical protein